MSRLERSNRTWRSHDHDRDLPQHCGQASARGSQAQAPVAAGGWAVGMRALQIRSAWLPLEEMEIQRLEPATGVYELRVDGEIRRIGYAGARSHFGLRGELGSLVGEVLGAEFRAEVTSAYLTRWHELLGVHLANHGSVPPGNQDAREQPVGLRSIGPRGKATP